jgi:ATP-binding cassette subfamily F protein uup
MLAKLFTRPSNVLVMDEPTNDLDVETLDLLEELLLEYSGTILLVSHDRDFLNNVVTSTLAIGTDGNVGNMSVATTTGSDSRRKRHPTFRGRLAGQAKPRRQRSGHAS